MTQQQRATDRKEQIITAALQVIIERGVHATTHRNIAEAAAVPLGSLTYYFDGLADLLVQAFELLHRRMAESLRAELQQAETSEEAVDVLTDVIYRDELQDDDLLRGLVELYSYANHNPTARQICRRWLTTTQETLRVHFPEHSILALDALLDGWRLQKSLTGQRLNRAMVRAAVQALVTQ